MTWLVYATTIFFVWRQLFVIGIMRFFGFQSKWLGVYLFLCILAWQLFDFLNFDLSLRPLWTSMPRGTLSHHSHITFHRLLNDQVFHEHLNPLLSHVVNNTYNIYVSTTTTKDKSQMKRALDHFTTSSNRLPFVLVVFSHLTTKN